MSIRRYSAPLTVLAAGVLGFSLICIVSAAALTSPITPNTSEIEAQDIVDSAFSNPINTAVAMTVVEITAFIPSPTPSLDISLTTSLTVSPFGTPTLRPFITWTPLSATRTREGGLIPATATKVPPTPTKVPPTSTRVIPTFTFTPVPDTNTPRPPTDTDTPVPPPTDTDTPVPPPTDTDTPVPPPTDTDTPVPPPADTDTPGPPPVTPTP